MKTKLLNLILIISIMICYSSCQSECEKNGFENYTKFTEYELNNLKPPVILIGKSKSLGDYSITVKDCNGIIKCFGSGSVLANDIGETRNVGDTLR